MLAIVINPLAFSKEVSVIKKGVIGVDDSSVHEESKSYNSAMGE
jgi:hypothetical protein